MNKLTILLVFVALSFGAGGCTALWLAGGAAAGAGTAAYVHGDLDKILQADYSEVWDASQDALEELNIKITEKEEKTNQGVIKGRMADDKSVSIRITPQTKGNTKLSIRVGVVGNEEESRKILDAIEARL